MGSAPILSIKQSVTISTMINFDGEGHGDGTCKQTFNHVIDLFQNQVDEAVKVLLLLKADYKSVTGKDWKPGAHKPAAQEPSKEEKQSPAPAQMSASSKLN